MCLKLCGPDNPFPNPDFSFFFFFGGGGSKERDSKWKREAGHGKS